MIEAIELNGKAIYMCSRLKLEKELQKGNSLEEENMLDMFDSDDYEESSFP